MNRKSNGQTGNEAVRTFENDPPIQTSGNHSLNRAIESLGVHDHLCLIYENRQEQFAATIPFIRIGLERGEQCIYIADDNDAAEVIEAMQADGIDTDAMVKSGSLSVISKQESYLKQGHFDPDWMIQFLKETTDAAKSKGFSALRVTGEMTWTLGGDPGVERLMEYESKLNDFFPENDALAICQYNRNRFEADTLRGVIETHPIVIHGNNIYQNFYYVPTQEFLGGRDSAKEVDRLLKNLADRRMVEERLRSSRDLTMAIVKHVPIRIFWKDRDMRYQGCNQLFARDAGFDNPDDLIGKTDFEIRWKDQAELFRAADEAVMASGMAKLNYEEPRTTSDGVSRWLRISKVPLRDASGEIIGVLGIYDDITEHRLAEEQTELSESRLREAQRVAQLGSWELDLVNNVLWWSDENYRVFGVEPDTGNTYETFLERVHPDDRDYVDQEYSGSVKNRTPYDIEHRLLMEDGTVKWVNERCETFYDKDGTPLRSVGTTLDITERKRAEEELRQRTLEAEKARKAMASMLEDLNESTRVIERGKAEWEATFDAVTDPIFLHDKKGRIVRANRAYAELSGLQAEAFVGLPYWQVFPKGEGPLPGCLKAREDRNEGKEEEVIAENGMVYLSRSYAVDDGNGQYNYSIHLMRDITELKRSAEVLEESHAKLESSLEGTIAAISRAVEARDPYTSGHQQRVALLASAIARAMGLEEDRVQGIHMGASIHDIGKIHLPAEILSKPANLSEIERSLIKSHPQIGYDILKDIDFPWPVAEIALQHHERFDGTGYPYGLQGESICLEARIVAVADVVEAMASHRPYRPSLGIDSALQEIETYRGSYFDPDVVDACLSLFRDQNFDMDALNHDQG